MKKRKVGILGGSFDPIHLGHLNLAVCLKEACALDRVLFVPAAQSPFKEAAPPLCTKEHRLAMVKMAIAPFEGFECSDLELRRGPPSYTIDTVRELLKDPSLQLHLLLGDDHLLTFSLWKEGDELMRLAPPLIGTRNLSEESPPQLLGCKKVKIPLFDISSTEIRHRLFEKKECHHLVPSSILNYIKQHHCYGSI